MGQDFNSSFVLGHVLRANPALALQVDKSGSSRFADQALVSRLAGLDNSADGASLAQSVTHALLARLPPELDLDSLNSDYVFDTRFEPWPGTQVYIRLQIRRLVGAEGEADGFALYCHDITELKQADNALARKNSSLELLLACSSRANRAQTFQQALADCLQQICSYEDWLYPGWLVGHAYLVDENDPDRLVSSDLWVCQARDKIEPFIMLTRATRLRRGIGIPGQVLETGKPVWHGKADSYPRFPRAELADKLGMVSLVAVPVISGENVVSVLELYADNERPPNAQMLDVLCAVGRELGLVYDRDFANRELQRLADHDPLTGLVIMRVARDRIDRSLAWADRQHASIALLFIDLDGFKQVNDSYGHDVGDELLRRVAGLLTERVREVDSVARFGGDEFVVLLGGRQSTAGAEAVARDILGALETPILLGDNAIEISASIGIAVSSQGKTSVDELIRRADAAMYEAKHSGKRCFRLHKDAPSAPAADGAS